MRYRLARWADVRWPVNDMTLSVYECDRCKVRTEPAAGNIPPPGWLLGQLQLCGDCAAKAGSDD